MRPFQAALDTCLDSLLPCQPLSSRFALHGLRALDPPPPQKKRKWTANPHFEQLMPRMIRQNLAGKDHIMWWMPPADWSLPSLGFPARPRVTRRMILNPILDYQSTQQPSLRVVLSYNKRRAPEKKFMCLISWERAQKRDPHKLFGGNLRGVPNGSVSVTKFGGWRFTPQIWGANPQKTLVLQGFLALPPQIWGVKSSPPKFGGWRFLRERAQRLTFWARRLPGGVGVFHRKTTPHHPSEPDLKHIRDNRNSHPFPKDPSVLKIVRRANSLRRERKTLRQQQNATGNAQKCFFF